MGFNFFRWLAGKTEGEAQPVDGAVFFELYADTYIRELAFLSCVNFTANALSKCEFVTCRGGQAVKGPEYYLWNVEPNQNQSSSVFLHKLVCELYRRNEALVVENRGRLYVADSFQRTPYALYEDIFSQVTIGDFTFHRSFTAGEVLYFRLNSEDVNRVVRGLYLSYGKLLAYGMSGYQRSRGTKGTLELDMQMAGSGEYKRRFEAIRNEEFKRFAEAENAVLPLFKGMKFSELSQKTYSSENTRDIRAMIDDVTDFTARAFGIPPFLLDGSVQNVDSAMDQVLTFCIDPLADNLQEEINRKRWGRDAYLRGHGLRIDTGSIKHIDILSAAPKVDKLLSSGVMCVNDIRALLGQSLINEPWAWEHFMTKNYAAVDKLLRRLEGEQNEQNH